MTPNEIAKREAEFLRSLPATVTVDGARITLAHDRGAFEIECLGEDRFLLGPSPMKGGLQARVLEPRVEGQSKRTIRSRPNVGASE